MNDHYDPKYDRLKLCDGPTHTHICLRENDKILVQFKVNDNKTLSITYVDSSIAEKFSEPQISWYPCEQAIADRVLHALDNKRWPYW